LRCRHVFLWERHLAAKSRLEASPTKKKLLTDKLWIRVMGPAASVSISGVADYGAWRHPIMNELWESFQPQ
jgi:hypothetical protein